MWFGLSGLVSILFLFTVITPPIKPRVVASFGRDGLPPTVDGVTLSRRKLNVSISLSDTSIFPVPLFLKTIIMLEEKWGFIS